MVERDYGPQEPQKEIILSGKTAYMYQGQASQRVGMGFELYEKSKAARRVFDEANEVLGFDFKEMIFYGPQNELTDTINAQPAIMIVGIATQAALQEALGEKTPQPDFVAGHSVGLYTAAVEAGALDFPKGLTVVRERGRLMHEASLERPGNMASIIGLDELIVEEVCSLTGAEVALINSNTEIVVSGDIRAIARTIDLALARGANERATKSLEVSGAFHSRLMDPARDELIKVLSGVTFKDPTVPIVANSTGGFLTTGENLKQELAKISERVRWKDGIERTAKAGVTNFMEFGHGRTLSNFVKRINEDLQTFPINSLKAINDFASS